MKKKLLTLVGIVSLLIGGVVLAVPAPKVFVCKYVGAPGVNERLQTGNNPISVSSNAIQNFQGVGSYFNDAQGRSYVLAVDNGQPEPDVSQCPQLQTPPNNPPSDTDTGSQISSSDQSTQSSAATGNTAEQPQLKPFQGK